MQRCPSRSASTSNALFGWQWLPVRRSHSLRPLACLADRQTHAKPVRSSLLGSSSSPWPPSLGRENAGGATETHRSTLGDLQVAGGVCAGTQKLGKGWRGLVIETGPRCDVPHGSPPVSMRQRSWGLERGNKPATTAPWAIGCLVSLYWLHAAGEAASVSALEPSAFQSFQHQHGMALVVRY
jgi:hypothetical protein